MIKQKSHNLSRSHTYNVPLGQVLGSSCWLLPRSYYGPRSKGHLNSGVQLEVKCCLAAHLYEAINVPSSCPQSIEGPGHVLGRGQSQHPPRLVFPALDALWNLARFVIQAGYRWGQHLGLVSDPSRQGSNTSLAKVTPEILIAPSVFLLAAA